MAIVQSSPRSCELTALSSAAPVRNAIATAAACEPIASTTDTASDQR